MSAFKTHANWQTSNTTCPTQSKPCSRVWAVTKLQTNTLVCLPSPHSRILLCLPPSLTMAYWNNSSTNTSSFQEENTSKYNSEKQHFRAYFRGQIHNTQVWHKATTILHKKQYFPQKNLQQKLDGISTQMDLAPQHACLSVPIKMFSTARSPFDAKPHNLVHHEFITSAQTQGPVTEEIEQVFPINAVGGWSPHGMKEQMNKYLPPFPFLSTCPSATAEEAVWKSKILEKAGHH